MSIRIAREGATRERRYLRNSKEWKNERSQDGRYAHSEVDAGDDDSDEERK